MYHVQIRIISWNTTSRFFILVKKKFLLSLETHFLHWVWDKSRGTKKDFRSELAGVSVCLFFLLTLWHFLWLEYFTRNIILYCFERLLKVSYNCPKSVFSTFICSLKSKHETCEDIVANLKIVVFFIKKIFIYVFSSGTCCKDLCLQYPLRM